MPDTSFSFNFPVPPKLHLADDHSQLYQTPSTTSASSSLYRAISTNNRKRSRIDESKKHRPLYDSPANDYDDDLQRSSWLACRDDAAEMDYDIPNGSGQLPRAPPIEASLDSLTPDEPSGNSRKRSRREAWIGGAAEQEAEVQDEKNGIPSSDTVGWGRSVMNAVGKVWSICWSGAFRGFYAGGGHGYSMSGAVPQLDDEISSFRQPTSTEKRAVAPATPGATTSGYYFTHHESTPVPGQYPDDSEIQQNWVVVPTDGAADCFPFGAENSSPSTPAKRAHRRSDSSGSSQTQYKLAAVPRVGKGTSLSRPSTPTRIPKLTPGSGKSPQSPASAETQRHIAQMRRMEREEDASLRRLNRQLQVMIREGKQALGTQVEVDDLDMDQYN